MVNSENFIHFNPDKKERKVPNLNNQKSLNYSNAPYLEEKHQAEKEQLFIKYEKEKEKIVWETNEALDKEQLINQARSEIYEKIWINNDLSKNSSIENFLKWVIDELIIWNYDLAIEIINTNWKVLFDALSQLTSVEGMKALAKWLEESVIKLASWNAYEKWKSIVELGLIWTWVFAGMKIAKFGMKKLKNINIPKHNFDNLSLDNIAKLSNADRLEAASFYLKKEFTDTEKNAIIKAHEVGENRVWAGIYNYNFSEKAEKLKILEEAGFSKEERKLLLEKWVCGKELEYKIISKDELPIRISDFIKKVDSYWESVLWNPDNIEIINLKIDEFINRVWWESTPSWKEYLELKKQVSHILEKKWYLAKLNWIEYKESENLFYRLDKEKRFKNTNSREQLISYNRSIETLKYSEGLNENTKILQNIDVLLEKQKILDADITLTGINEIIRDHSFYENMTLMHKEILSNNRMWEILDTYINKNNQTEKICKLVLDNYDKLNINQKVVLRVYLSHIVKNSYIITEKIWFKNINWAHFVTQANILLEWHPLNKTMNKLWLDKEVLHKLQKVRDKRLESNKKIVAYN